MGGGGEPKQTSEKERGRALEILFYVERKERLLTSPAAIKKNKPIVLQKILSQQSPRMLSSWCT